MIICDTREKRNNHILAYFDTHKVNYAVKKLDTGDYMNDADLSVTVDRKRNLDELLHNMKSPDSSRFWREIRRSKESHIRMIVLCEHGGKIKQISDVAGWQSEYSRVTGRQLMNEIYKCHIGYGVEFMFCDKRHTAKKILELLNYDNR